jgi:hypothetical protein
MSCTTDGTSKRPGVAVAFGLGLEGGLGIWEGSGVADTMGVLSRESLSLQAPITIENAATNMSWWHAMRMI